jgi:hypothetical protein
LGHISHSVITNIKMPRFGNCSCRSPGDRSALKVRPGFSYTAQG